MFLLENKLRPSSVAVRRHLPPKGKAVLKAEINFWTIVLQSVTRRAMPAPEGEGYEIGSHFNFIRFITIRYETGDARNNFVYETAPHQSVSRTASPQGEALM